MKPIVLPDLAPGDTYEIRRRFRLLNHCAERDSGMRFWQVVTHEYGWHPNQFVRWAWRWQSHWHDWVMLRILVEEGLVEQVGRGYRTRQSEAAWIYAAKIRCCNRLLSNIRAQLPQLQKLLYSYEDPIYRFYHHSFKVYNIQAQTQQLVGALESVAPAPNKDANFTGKLNSWFLEIVRDGGAFDHKAWKHSHNQEWLQHTRPMVEAFFHAHYALQMAVKYAQEFETLPHGLPSGLAAVLEIYNLR